MKLVLASKNQKKLVEMNEILSHLGIQVCSEAEAGVDVEVEETGTTFEENSLLKAEAVMEASGMPAIADDSGLCVDGQVRVGHHLLFSKRGCDLRPGGVPRHHRLCSYGGGRLRL